MKLSGKKKIIYALSVLVLLILAISFIGVFDSKAGICVALAATFIFSLVLAYVSHKDKIKMIEVIMIIAAFISFVLFIVNFIIYKKNNILTTYPFQITLEEKESPKTLLFTYNDKMYYSYNVGNIEVIMEDGTKYPLKEALETKKVTLSKILSLATPSNDTTGYKIYYDGGQKKYNNDKYSIVVCEGTSKDIIFSTFDYEYEKEICS